MKNYDECGYRAYSGVQLLHDFHKGSVGIGGRLLPPTGDQSLHAIDMRHSPLLPVGVEQGLRAEQVLLDVHALRRR